MQDVQLEHLGRRLAAYAPSRLSFPHRVERASVAVVLSERSEALSVLLVRRAARRGDPWSGHLAFPGGVAGSGESSVETAIRETREETGLELGAARRMGRLSDRVTLSHGGTHLLVVTPWVFGSSPLSELRLGPEVASVHSVDLAEVCRARARLRSWRRWLGHLHPSAGYRVAGTELWGLTLRMLDELCRASGAATKKLG